MDDPALITKERLISIDALRGFAMFLILAYDIGGAPVLQTFIKLWGDNFANTASVQLEYHFTEGLRLSFIAMPMFLFVVGLVIPLSLNNRLLEKDKKVMIDYRTIGLKLYMASSDDFTHMQVYTPKGRKFFCVEKQTCSTDAHNLYAKGYEKEAHLLVVEAGKEHDGYVEFSYEYDID